MKSSHRIISRKQNCTEGLALQKRSQTKLAHENLLFDAPFRKNLGYYRNWWRIFNLSVVTVRKVLVMGLNGDILLVLYGIIATWHLPVYSAYGGIFIILTILWVMNVDNITPDEFDILGGIVAFIGMGIIMVCTKRLNNDQ